MHPNDEKLLDAIREARYRELLYDLELEFPDLIKQSTQNETDNTNGKRKR